MQWLACLGPTTCPFCALSHGKIFSIDEDIFPCPPVHDRCACSIISLKALLAGTATNNGKSGADWILKHTGRLPGYYISKEDAENLGWIPILGNLSSVAPGKMIGGEQFKNRQGRLPQAEGRIWYEADINYTSLWRNDDRILFSNDGLIFVTYDHYMTFIEII